MTIKKNRNKFVESGIVFEFPDGWVVQKYDDHRFYKYLSGLGLKGVDFIAISEKGELILMEVKNYRNRFPQDGINPSDTLLQIPELFSQKIISKFQDSFRLIIIIQQYFYRQRMYRWVTLPIIRILPKKIWLNWDWGFWTFGYELLISQKLSLILWLEMSEMVSEEMSTAFKEKILIRLEKDFPEKKIFLSSKNKTQHLIRATFQTIL